MMNALLKRLKLVEELLIYHTPKTLTALLFTLVLMLITTVRADSSLPSMLNPQVTLQSNSGSTISFFDANGVIPDGSKSQFHTLPQLVLFRNGILTEPQERTLNIEIGALNLPPSGAFISIEVSTQNEVKTSREDTLMRFQVWQETKWIMPSSNTEKSGQTIVFHHEFKESFISNGDVVLTPTDYFQINIRISLDGSPLTNPLFQYTQDFAFLMENQWLTNLPQVLENSPGSAPTELIVYYSDMFFPNIHVNSKLGFPRKNVNHYIQSELIPAMLEAYQTESITWGFPWYEEWQSYRADEPTKRLSVALTNHETWYHGEAPEIGNARISINLHSKENKSYKNLTESVISNFYHEMFHNHQRNINLHLGGNGDIDGTGKAWQFFSEGTAVLASSVGQPGVQFSPIPGVRSYLINANGFLAGGGPVKRDIYNSYQDINPYHASIYWRFLFEQCGGMTVGSENPKAGMQIIHNILTALYSMGIVDIQTSTNLIEHLPDIMNEAFNQTPRCPFANYEDSLNKFARAIYSLKLENGRCLLPGEPLGCGFYDPASLYLGLPIPIIKYNSEMIIFESSDHLDPEKLNSFGIRFVEVELGQSTDGKPFNLELINDLDSTASFDLQILKLKRQAKRSLLETYSATTIKPDKVGTSETNQKLEYSIPEIELDKYNRLGLIITRTDNHEILGDSSGYTIRLD